MKVILFFLLMAPFLVSAQDKTPSPVEERYRQDNVPPKGIKVLPQQQEEKEDNSIENPFDVGPYEAGKYHYLPKEEEEAER